MPTIATIQRLYAAAQARWPLVKWPPEAFDAHLAGESPAWPSDLYLAGAAGHRMQSAWEAIETEIGPQTRRVLARQPVADLTIEDLWGETIARIMDDDLERAPLDQGRPPARIIRYRGLVQLVNYLILIARRIAIQRNRRRQHHLSLSQESADPAQHVDPPAPGPSALSSATEAETVGKMRQGLARAFAGLSPDQQFLITMVFRQGMKQKEAGAMLGWSEFKTSRTLSAAIESLRQGMVDLTGVEWTPALASAWAECLAENWKDVQEPAGHASNRKATGA